MKSSASAPGDGACPSSLCGVWKQNGKSESLCPFLTGLGMPLLPVACRVADATTTTLRITCPGGPGEDGPAAAASAASGGSEFEIVDKTVFGRNSTKVVLGGPEVEKTTRGGRKKFMLSGRREEADAAVAAGAEQSVITCRLFQRGEGWATKQVRYVDASNPKVLVEKNILERPGEDDITVIRYFDKQDELSAKLAKEEAEQR